VSAILPMEGESLHTFKEVFGGDLWISVRGPRSSRWPASAELGGIAENFDILVDADDSGQFDITATRPGGFRLHAIRFTRTPDTLRDCWGRPSISVSSRVSLVQDSVMLQEELAGLISPYASASARDAIQRLRAHSLDLQPHVEQRLLSAIQDLIRVKAELISQNAGLDSLAYPVDDGLGAMCITCVEKHVAAILAAYRFPSEISCRQFWPSFYTDEVRGPPIHAYSTVELGGMPLIIDIDADPFVGKNLGVVLAPFDADIPLYRNGFLYHRRHFAATGQIDRYACYYHRDCGDVYKYMEGDVAEYMTIAPYHFESDSNLCPICFTGGTTLYFGFDKCITENRAVCHQIPLVLVCPMFSGTWDRVYQLKFTGVHDFTVRRQVDRGAAINVVLLGGVSIELRLSGDGCLIENDWISFVAAPQASLGTFRISFGSRSFSRGPVELPKPS